MGAMSEQLTTATTYPVSQGRHQSLIEQHCTANMTWHRCKSFKVSCLRSACCFACGSSKTYRQCTALCCSLVLRRASALGLCTYAGQSCLYSGFYASDRGKMLPKPVAGVTSVGNVNVADMQHYAWASLLTCTGTASHCLSSFLWLHMKSESTVSMLIPHV